MELIGVSLQFSLILLWSVAVFVQTKKLSDNTYNNLPMIKSNLKLLQVILILLLTQEIFFFLHDFVPEGIITHEMGLGVKLLVASTVLYLIYFKKGFKMA